MRSLTEDRAARADQTSAESTIFPLLEIKVSIIVPVFNSGCCVGRCFDSISAQTYRSLECIFVDDASSDDSLAILRDRIERYEGPCEFQVLRHETNKGVSAARNTGTWAATGGYLYYLDSDDAISDRAIERLIDSALKYDGVDIVQGNTEVMPDTAQEVDGEFWSITGKGFPEFSNDKKWIKTRFLVEPRVPVDVWNKLLRREFVIGNKLYFREGVIHEDQLWAFHAAKCVSSIAFVTEICYRHYIVPGSIMQSGDAKRSLVSWLAILEEMSENEDDVCRAAQRALILRKLKASMRRLNREVFCKALLGQYRRLIKRNLLTSIRQRDPQTVLFYCIYLLPPAIFRNALLRKISRRLMNAV